jgi:6-pyruvoyltetrahydropterin/6-carboxytetrahydropterin synthase
MPVVTVTRRLKFNAAHRVHNPAFSDERNRETFGKCNNPHGHGHNYVLDVSVSGEIDPETGYVMDLSRLNKLVEREVVNQVDHHNLNVDVPFMQGIIPTAENLIVAFWRILSPAVAPATLTRLVLWETDNNYVEYTGH